MERFRANTVVIGGHSRNIGKTGVMAGLIRRLRSYGWTAVKITQYGHGICSLDGEPCGCAPTEHSFLLTEERDARGRSDTARLLAAGARRSLWLRVRQGQLAEALPTLERALKSSAWVMMESNSVLEFIRPKVYLAVLNDAERDFKPSARRFLERADALVTMGGTLNARAWPGIDAAILEAKPHFALRPKHYDSEDLCRFVRQKLGLPRAAALAAAASVS
jgi:hypothetical protein